MNIDYKKSLESLTTIIILVLLLAAAVAQNGKLLGVKHGDWFAKEQKLERSIAPTASQLSEAGYTNVQTIEQKQGVWSIVRNQQTLGKVIATLENNHKTFGFAGPIPMYLFLDNNDVIQHITILDNSEDVDFLNSALDAGIITQWIGQNPESLLTYKPDAVTGATMSSQAINLSVQRSMPALVSGYTEQNKRFHLVLTSKELLALVVLLFGIFVAYNTRKYPKIRPLLLIVNCVILGFWCGKFISLSTLLGYVENGTTWQANFIGIIMLVLAIIMPVFFNKKSYYCTYICPFGAAQELAGKVYKSKIKIPSKVIAILKHTRQIITAVIFIAMWLGTSTTIAGYEPFAAFIFKHASIPVIIIAIISIVLSIFTPRPWCRYACPTGQLLQWVEKMK